MSTLVFIPSKFLDRSKRTFEAGGGTFDIKPTHFKFMSGWCNKMVDGQLTYNHVLDIFLGAELPSDCKRQQA